MKIKLEKHLATTATITNHMILRVDRRRVDLFESQGGQWIVIRSRIDRATAGRYGFNLDSPRVQEVFDGIQ